MQILLTELLSSKNNECIEIYIGSGYSPIKIYPASEKCSINDTYIRIFRNIESFTDNHQFSTPDISYKESEIIPFSKIVKIKVKSSL